VFILGYGVSSQRFGLFFGANAVGLIGASQLNRLVLRRYSPTRILIWAYGLLLVLVLVLAVQVILGPGGFVGFTINLFLCIAVLGFIYPNLAALSLAPLGKAAGSASALLGLAQFGLGSAGGTAISLVHAAPPVSMVCAMAAFGITGFAVL